MSVEAVLVESILSLLDAGWVLWPLLVCLLVISYGCAIRYLNFRRISQAIHLSSDRDNPYSFFFHKAFLLPKNKVNHKKLKEIFFPLENELGYARGITMSLIALAPLLGLLGTVEGMIETFDSLGGMQMHSESGGIAAGISQALISTQVGLMVAVPGLILARSLNQKEDQLRHEVTQFINRQVIESRESI